MKKKSINIKKEYLSITILAHNILAENCILSG